MSKNNTPIEEPQPELISVYEFARRKGVEAPAVYYRIKETFQIRTVKIGKRIAINWEQNKHIEFPNKDRFKKVPEQTTELANTAETL